MKMKKGIMAIVGTLMAISMSAHASLSDGLVLYYSFNNEPVGGIVADESGKGNDATVNGATHEAGGRVGGALAFNGAGDFLRVLNPYIIEFWDNPSYSISLWFLSETDDNFLNNGTMISDFTRYHISAGYSGTDKILYSNSARSTPMISTPLCVAPDTWHHVALLIDENAVPAAKIYVDGQLVGTQNSGSVSGGIADLLIGAFNDFGSPVAFWNGLLDEVRIYERVLSEAEITELANPAGGSGGGAQRSVLSLGLSKSADGDGNITEFSRGDTVFIRFTDVNFVPGTPKTTVKVTIKSDKGKAKDLKLDMVGQADGSFLGSTSLAGWDIGETKITIEGKTSDKERRRIETFITVK